MEIINLKFINFSPDFSNKNMIADALTVFNKIKKKDNDFFEQFGFNELAFKFWYPKFKRIR
nr:hypothetical protein [Mycoplasmopsis bovis]